VLELEKQTDSPLVASQVMQVISCLRSFSTCGSERQLCPNGGLAVFWLRQTDTASWQTRPIPRERQTPVQAHTPFYLTSHLRHTSATVACQATDRLRFRPKSVQRLEPPSERHDLLYLSTSPSTRGQAAVGPQAHGLVYLSAGLGTWSMCPHASEHLVWSVWSAWSVCPRALEHEDDLATHALPEGAALEHVGVRRQRHAEVLVRGQQVEEQLAPALCQDGPAGIRV
jgi:hypothetical protein